MLEKPECEEEAHPVVSGHDQHFALKKEIQDLTYLNGKLRNDREKSTLRVREVEFQFKEKEKLVLREIRHAKNYYERKLKIR